MTKYESTDPHCFYFVKSLKPEMEMNKSQVVIRLPEGLESARLSRDSPEDDGMHVLTIF